MAVGLFAAAQHPISIDRPLWRLVKGQRCASAVVRVYAELPKARELRINVDGDLRWCCLYRGAGLEASASEKRAALEERGWTATRQKPAQLGITYPAPACRRLLH